MNEITLRGFITIIGILVFVGTLGAIDNKNREIAQLKNTCQEVTNGSV